MNTCQLERIEETLTSTLFPLHSYALGEIKNHRCGISVFYPQTVMIRAIDFQQWQQVVNNPLTERELCVLKMLVDGKSNSNIAEELYLTVGTIKTHVRNILRKLDVTDRTQATVLALRSGLVD
ncbi:two-component response regulator [Anabaenopsis circularis NIES-21]|uniref:Two-component response regulator n=1 Tax=Anabaenopsis circularis NIES-21 TaxID=1085406 RepID=A0A1Z4GBU5_9CYAN|nr:two-component response regulator [Anabaenopsis circularis NIES-21]